MNQIFLALTITQWLSLLIGIISLFVYLWLILNKRQKYKTIARDALILALLAIGAFSFQMRYAPRSYVFDPKEIPEVNKEGHITLNGGHPYFDEDELNWQEGKLYFSELDSLGRCREAYALLTQDNLPNEARGPLNYQPSGWKTIRYDDLIEDKYLYNRCHLIAFELCGENDNPLNLITGTRYMNLNMVIKENQVSAYLHRTANPVYYRVTPVFDNRDLVARGILIEAKSKEDDEIEICEYYYNIQPGITIDYLTGDSTKD